MNPDRIILLDRDGVINQDRDDYIKTPEEWNPIPGSLEAIARLYLSGFHIFVITNQSGIGRGLYTLQTMHKIHDKMKNLLEESGGNIEQIYFCPHHPDEKCKCRKPETGMLDQLCSDYNISLVGVPFVGDTTKDIRAALAVGADPKFVLTGKGIREVELVQKQFPEVDIFDDLSSFVNHFLDENDQKTTN